MDHLGYMIILSLAVMVTSQTCLSPTTSCTCFVDKNGKKIINCRYKSLTQIPTFKTSSVVYDEIRFHTTEDTGKCQYSCNNITTLNMNAFGNLKVRKIDLRNNPISTVSADAFDNLIDDLQELLIEGDGQVDPPYSAIAVLENLVTLHLENYVSSIIQIPDAILPLPRLQSLTLTKWRNLHTLEKDVFSVMTSLKSFNLLYLPSLLMLPIPIIQMFHNLSTIEVTDTAIQSIPGEIFSPLQSPTDVKIRHNYNLRRIDDRAFHGVSDTIVSLNLVENRLSNLKFLSNSNWSKLSQLDIAYNDDLHTLPSGTFSTMQTLTYLQCQQIGLQNISDTMFSNLTNLHIIDLSYNNIRNIATGTFRNSPSLVELHLDHQYTDEVTLTFQDNAFNGIEKSLEILSLSGDKLSMSETWREIEKLTTLKTLELENVGITNIPNLVFSQNTQLESINLSNNNISSISQETFYGPRHGLKFIDLQNNHIATLHQCVLNDFTNQPIINLAGNPLYCDCDLVWLYDWVQNRQNPETVYTIGTCDRPLSLANKYFDEFVRSEMCPRETTSPNCLDLTAIFTSMSSTLNITRSPLKSIELRLDRTGTSFIELLWLVSNITNIAGYKLEMKSPHSSTMIIRISDIHATSYTFNNLLPGNYYTFCLHILSTDRESVGYCITANTTSVSTEPVNLTTMKTTANGTQPEVIVG